MSSSGTAAPGRAQTQRIPFGWRRGRLALPPSLQALLWLTVVIVPYYWRVLSHQFSILTGYEGVDQAYAWLNFAIRSIRQGTFPIWDPYARSGFPFAGEMQTGAFYPPYLLFALAPSVHGALSPGFFHIFYVATHIFGAFFMYLLARELSLSFFPSVIAGICFSLGGFVGSMTDWMHMLHSGIWLPLLFFFLIRALRAAALRRAMLYAAFSGLCLALSILAGGLHLAIMQALVAAAAIVFSAAQSRGTAGAATPKTAWFRATLLLIVFGATSLAGGAVQLLPSAEYSRLALRWLGGEMALPAAAKIPFGNLGDGLAAHSFLTWLVPLLPGSVASGEYFGAYLGVFPLLLAAIGVWKQWSHPWVRFFAGLVLAAFLYTLGKSSFLYGLLYAVTPLLWMAREANRFVYLIDFGLVILAAFGLEAVLQSASAASWEPLNRILRWVAIACFAVLGYYALLGTGVLNGWTSLSILLVLLSIGLFRYLAARPRGAWGRFLIAGLIAFDLYAFDWSAMNVDEVSAKNADALERLLSGQKVSAFLQSRPGRPFRVEVPGSMPPSFGDLFGIQMTTGAGVTSLEDYVRLVTHPDLLDARYIIRPASAPDPGPVIYRDAAWKVFENPQAYPRVWMVHQISVEPSIDELRRKVDSGSVDLHQAALLDAPLKDALDPKPTGIDETAAIRVFESTQMEIKVHAGSRALLVLSEVFYPGWKAEVNGHEAAIWKVDGGLRGVVVPAGESTVRLQYAPASFRIGAALSAAAFLACPLLALFWRRTGGR